jgi:Coenzyme PQQ synthesis protein D (PqqD)
MSESSQMEDLTWRPARVSEIEINEVADGYIVHDRAADKVHYLNHTAAILLELCNGQSTLGELPELLRQAFDLSEPPHAEVRDCLEQLIKEGLIN